MPSQVAATLISTRSAGMPPAWYSPMMRSARVNEVLVSKLRRASQALAGCDLLTISPELLAALAALEQPLARVLEPLAARALDLPAVNFDEAGFRFALNQDAMATDKLAEGICAFCVDAVKLERMFGA